MSCASLPRQALEKNQQWLTYDRQREAYVQSVSARTQELERQLAEAKQQLQTTREAPSDGEKGGRDSIGCFKPSPCSACDMKGKGTMPSAEKFTFKLQRVF